MTPEPLRSLTGKVAVVYGAGGAIGGAVARAFAAEGARVFATGPHRESVDMVVKEITAVGGTAEAAEVDALDEQAVDGHLRYVADTADRVDISFNAFGLRHTDILGVPLADMDAERFLAPITAYTASYFLTARLAARRMIPRGSGVIMTVTALPARTATALNGGYGPALAAKEALTRDLSLEFAPHGVRVVGLRPHGMPETGTMRKVFDARPPGPTWEEFQEYLAGSAHGKRLMVLREVADAAVFLASDRASGMTGTTVNLTMGAVAD
jgi:NAD(P)-dependent dehydrogenase (short-subunit alcohol dehydrogenase family)